MLFVLFMLFHKTMLLASEELEMLLNFMLVINVKGYRIRVRGGAILLLVMRSKVIGLG